MNVKHFDEDSRKHIEQLEAELRIARQQLTKQQQQLEARRQELVHKYGLELLALIEGDPRAKVFVTPIVERLVFQDEQGNVRSETDGIVVGRVVEVKFIDPPQ